jgi:hypothetical protein
VNDSLGVYLAVMAVALAIIAVVQIGVIIVAIRLGKQIGATVEEIRREVRPLVEKAHRISDDAARATSLAVAQIEKVNHLLTNTSTRVSETLGLVQHAVVEPVRQGAAVVAAVRAAMTAFRSWRVAHPHSRDDDDALFVG